MVGSFRYVSAYRQGHDCMKIIRTVVGYPGQSRERGIIRYLGVNSEQSANQNEENSIWLSSADVQPPTEPRLSEREALVNHHHRYIPKFHAQMPLEENIDTRSHCRNQH
jgi:citrate synthase